MSSPLFKHVNRHHDSLQVSSGLGIFAIIHKMVPVYENGTFRNLKASCDPENVKTQVLLTLKGKFQEGWAYLPQEMSFPTKHTETLLLGESPNQIIHGSFYFKYFILCVLSLLSIFKRMF